MFFKLSPAAALILHLYANAPAPDHPRSLPNDLPTTPDVSPTTPDVSPLAQYPTIRALSQTPFITTYQHVAPFLLSLESFFEDNPLLAATLRPATQQRYAVALDTFTKSSIFQEQDDLSLDQRLSIYIQDRFMDDPRAGQRQEMANLVCALLLMSPNLKQELGLARRCLSGWKTLQPARRPASAVILLLSYCACLRVSEALSLEWANVALPGDVRLDSYGSKVAGINIVGAKTSRYSGDLQFVQVDDEDAITLLHALHTSPNRTNSVATVSYQSYSTHLRAAAKIFGFPPNAFTIHSARIGRATEDYIRGIPVAQIAINGRWKSINSLRYYLTNGRAWILKNQVDAANQAKIKSAAAQISHLLRMARQTATIQ